LGIVDEFKRGYEGSASYRYEVAGKIVTCSHCGGQEFEEGSALLNTGGLTFLNLDWVNREASLLECVNCGKVEWFTREPARKRVST